MTILSKRIFVSCSCGALFTYPAEIDRVELECGGCGSTPLSRRDDRVLAILDENELDADPTFADVPKAVLNDGSRTPV